MLKISNLHVKVEDKSILRGVNLSVKAGEMHAIMGPNGSGKSTLASFLAGKARYEKTKGQVLFKGKDLLKLSPEERALAGVFLAFQYPVEIPGVNIATFLKAAVNEKRKHQKQEPLDAFEFLELAKEKMALLGLDEKWLERSVNEGFSGGEKKKLEMLQMALLEPDLAILDETDSGLDIDALKDVAKAVNAIRTKKMAVLIITHYQRILKYLKVDRVHVLAKGKVVKSGDKKLAAELEKKGYDWLTKK